MGLPGLAPAILLVKLWVDLGRWIEARKQDRMAATENCPFPPMLQLHPHAALCPPKFTGIRAPLEAAATWPPQFTICNGSQAALYSTWHMAITKRCSVLVEYEFQQFSNPMGLDHKLLLGWHSLLCVAVIHCSSSYWRHCFSHTTDILQPLLSIKQSYCGQKTHQRHVKNSPIESLERCSIRKVWERAVILSMRHKTLQEGRI